MRPAVVMLKVDLGTENTIDFNEINKQYTYQGWRAAISKRSTRRNIGYLANVLLPPSCAISNESDITVSSCHYMRVLKTRLKEFRNENSNNEETNCGLEYDEFGDRTENVLFSVIAGNFSIGDISGKYNFLITDISKYEPVMNL